MKQFTIVKQIIKAAKSDGRGVTELARAAGMNHGNLSKFLDEKREGISLAAFARLCDVLKLELRPCPLPHNKQKRKGTK
jgi:DNA-binding Xre family transcriptional regulator